MELLCPFGKHAFTIKMIEIDLRLAVNGHHWSFVILNFARRSAIRR
jgi:type III secretory pathway component EscS